MPHIYSGIQLKDIIELNKGKNKTAIIASTGPSLNKQIELLRKVAPHALILIPDASTGTDQLGRYIYVIDSNNIVSYRHIEVGEIINDSLIHVKSGLSPDEKFVTKALLKVRSGMKVEPINN